MTTGNKQVKRRLFGTDGIRAEVGQYPMTAEMMLRLGQVLGVYFRRQNKQARILIGKDTRQSGYMLEQALSSGLCSVGVDTFLLGPLPTPGIAYLTRGLRAQAGIVISASHNPYQDNGVKIFAGDGYKLADEVEAELESMLFSKEEFSLQDSSAGFGKTKRIDDALGQYAVFLKEKLPKHLSLDGFKIALDCAHGAAYKLAPKVFQELGAELICLGVEPNGQNINQEVGALYPQRLAEIVQKEVCDLGFCLDGDADRLVAIDEKGEVLDGDELMAICAIYYSQTARLKNKRVVATVMSNLGLEKALEKNGISLERTAVGDRYVVEKIRKEKLSLGGEQSGHLIFHDSSTTGDSVLAALCLLEVLLTTKKPLSQLRLCMQKLPQKTLSFSVRQKIPLDSLPTLKALIVKKEKELAGKGRILFRYSGTENKARLMLEGEDKELINKIAEEISSLAKSLLAHKSKVQSVHDVQML